ncbi:hypothetical protein TCAL_11712 [Tigriopus californicus]|uniref:CCR4-NOT transcription complex subunit 10 n=1 Tax=Tigriopus californicus TaxID=6832 RepID=A0A553ND74_TIGCA|nr:CCR4-NOT transcription complex subunit 10-like [Tigriopus californicus]TRY63383.1 hypothetical protein TCAL_11712 [Tigriopus californicus]
MASGVEDAPVDALGAGDGPEETAAAEAAAAAAYAALTTLRSSPLARRALEEMSSGEWQAAVESLKRLAAEATMEDPCLLLNWCVAKFRAGLLTLPTFYQTLINLYQSVCKSADYEVSDHVPLLYNLAWAALHVRKPYLAYRLLDQIFRCMRESSPATPTKLQEEQLNKNVVPLLLIVLQMCRIPSLIQNILAQIPEPDSPVRSKLAPLALESHHRMLAKASALVFTRQNKTFKRDLKPNCIESGPNADSFEFLRANIEYLRGNQRKAQKLLSNIESKGPLSPRLLPVFQNNMGCVYLMNGNPCSAALAFRNAYTTLTNDLPQIEKEFPHDSLLVDKRLEILYNWGLSCLFRGDYGRAMSSFKATAPVMDKSPHYHLRVAECIIAANAPRSSHFEMMKGRGGGHPALERPEWEEPLVDRGVNLNVLGPMFHETFILENVPGSEGHAQKKELEVSYPQFNWNYAEARANLYEAMACLDDYQSSPVKSVFKGGPITSRHQILRAHILAKQCYVDLQLEDPYNCLDRANQLFELSSALSPALKTVGRLYLAQSKAMMGNLDGAFADLEPEKAMREVVKSDDDNPSDKDKVAAQSEVGPLKVMFEYNLMVAWLRKEDFAKAETLIDRHLHWKAKNSHKVQLLGPQWVMAKAFVLLKQGQKAKCREFIFKHCNVSSSLLCCELAAANNAKK